MDASPIGDGAAAAIISEGVRVGAAKDSGEDSEPGATTRLEGTMLGAPEPVLIVEVWVKAAAAERAGCRTWNTMSRAQDTKIVRGRAGLCMS